MLFRRFYCRKSRNPTLSFLTMMKGCIDMAIMIIEEKDLFTVDESYHLVHCISADYALGRGIAKEFDKRFNLRFKLQRVGSGIYPDCILIGRVFNLVTKKSYASKPTYKTLVEALIQMRQWVEERFILKLAMPKIGCGLDRLEWGKVLKAIELVFDRVDIEIRICIWGD